jgi:hypothetical protein
MLETERLILRALSLGTAEGSAREAARRLLGTYRWREPVHGAIYDVLMSLPANDPEFVREQLPARLTRRGFPDFDFADFLKPATLSREEVERLMRQLLEERSDSVL